MIKRRKTKEVEKDDIITEVKKSVTDLDLKIQKVGLQLK